MKSMIAGALMALTPALAAAEGITAVDPHAFATAPTAKAGGAYVSLMNHGSADRLVGATGDVAKRIEIHEHRMDDGVMRMREVEAGIELPANGKIEMKPGGYHVMLMGLEAPLEAGTNFPLTLSFESGKTLDVDIAVRERGDKGAHGGHGDHSDHKTHGDHSDHSDHSGHAPKE